MTLAQHLAAGYAFEMHGGSDPAPVCAREVAWGDLIHEQARLEEIAQRDHISRVRLRFVKRCLALSERK